MMSFGSSFIHQIFIKTLSPSEYSSEHKRQRFPCLWPLYSVSFLYPPTKLLSDFLMPGGKSKFLDMVGLAFRGSGLL